MPTAPSVRGEIPGPIPDWQDRTGGLGSWVGFLVDDVREVYDRLVAAD